MILCRESFVVPNSEPNKTFYACTLLANYAKCSKYLKTVLTGHNYINSLEQTHRLAKMQMQIQIQWQQQQLQTQMQIQIQ